MSGIFPSVRGTGPIMGRLRHEPSMLQPREAETTTLSLRDPPPVETVNADGTVALRAVLRTCRAGRARAARRSRRRRRPTWHATSPRTSVPKACRAGFARLLDAPLVLQRYSRLVVDCNRPFAAPDCFPALSDGTPVPGNGGLTEQERRRRFEEIHQPFHRALAALARPARRAGGASTWWPSTASRRGSPAGRSGRGTSAPSPTATAASQPASSRLSGSPKPGV